MKSPHHNLLICKIEYWWRQIILKSSLKRIFLYCWNLIALQNLTRTDWDKATVKFAARSDDILIYALQKRKQFSLVYSLSWRKKKGLRPVGLRFRSVGLRFRPVGLRFRPVGLGFRPVGLRFRPQGLRSSVFVFGSSFSTHPPGI